ncbi:MAG: CoA-binding protein, partial [Deltaproteobacteria bacterium]|nr:CoA-binding protein [Deltaproteobacteria bacterium]
MGFSKIVGIGNRLNVDFAEMLEYLSHDPDTSAVALYVEGIDEARSLLQAARDCTKIKPIVAYKTGSARVGDMASASHTGSVAGDYDIYNAAFKQAGIIPVVDSQQLLDTAKALAHCPIPSGNGIAILSGQAGPGMAASDVCEKHGLNIARFTDSTQARINELLPPLALRTNPVDMGPAWYDASAIAGIVEAVLNDENVDAILLYMMFASANADAIERMTGLLQQWNQQKPIISCLLSPPGIWDDQV